MVSWRFFYEYQKGRRGEKPRYSATVDLSATNLYEAMRFFNLWASGQPDNRARIKMISIEALEPPTEQVGKEKRKNDN